jgi:outer membrane receptor protein involved in Fe transport
MMRDSSSPYFARLDPTSGRILNASNLALTTAGVRTGTAGLPISRHQFGFVAPNGGIFDAIKPGDFTTPNAALTISGHTMYEVSAGALKGLSIGSTARWQHNIRQGYTIINGIRQLYYQPDFAVFDMRSGYEIKVGRQKWKLQLTLQNLFNEQQVIKTRSATTGALSNVNITEAARTFIVSASVRL